MIFLINIILIVTLLVKPRSYFLRDYRYYYQYFRLLYLFYIVIFISIITHYFVFMKTTIAIVPFSKSSLVTVVITII